MIDTPESIRQQMDETRSHLSQNLAALEHQVSKTVQSTGNAVNATVDSLRETVEAVTGTVQGAVQSVGNAFDIRRQVEKHPWLIFGGAIAVGYLAEKLLSGPAKSVRSPTITPQPRPTTDPATVAPTGEPRKDESFWHHFSSAAIGPFLGLVQEAATQAAPLVVAYFAGPRANDQNGRQSESPSAATSQGTNGRRKQLDSSDWD